MAKTGPKRTDAQRERDMAEIARRYLRGETQAQIARAVGITQQQVSYDLKRIRQKWKEETVFDFEEAIIEQLKRIDALESEYWQQYERSKLGRTKEIVAITGKRRPGDKKDEAPQPDRVTKTNITEDTPGDPRYLAGVQWCIQERSKLLGLYAPQEINLRAQDAEAASVLMLDMDALNRHADRLPALLSSSGINIEIVDAESVEVVDEAASN